MDGCPGFRFKFLRHAAKFALPNMEPQTRSQALFAEARRYIPGGVNSPVRAFRSVGSEPSTHWCVQ